METIRLNKYLAHCGVCSRRDADRLIEQGQVSVNGHTARPGQQVSGQDEIVVAGKGCWRIKKQLYLHFISLWA